MGLGGSETPSFFISGLVDLCLRHGLIDLCLRHAGEDSFRFSVPPTGTVAATADRETKSYN